MQQISVKICKTDGKSRTIGGKMSNKTEEAYIQCPFYLRSTDLRIFCEGYIPSTCMITSFPNKKSAAAHKKAYCNLVNGGMCKFAQVLFEKYNSEN